MKLIFLCTLLCAATCMYSQKTITVVDELKNFYNISELPSYRSNTYSAQVSSYDTTGGNNDGFGGHYSFIRRNADSSLVIFDVKGTGVINRIWTPTPTRDTLDFYIDDAKQPTLSINYMDLFSGKVYPFVQPLCGNQLGGYYCYFPILFQKHYVKALPFIVIIPHCFRVNIFTQNNIRKLRIDIDSIRYIHFGVFICIN